MNRTHPRRRQGTPWIILILALAGGCEDTPQARDESADSAPMAMPDGSAHGALDGGSLTLDATFDAMLDPASDAELPDAAGAAAIRLNEVSCRGDEWIEVYHLGPGPASLSGWTLTDDSDAADAVFAFPEVTLQPGVAWVSPAPPGLPFRIGCDGDTVRLNAPSGAVVDPVVLGNPPRGLTWGRLPDGTGAWGPTRATPGAANAPPATPQVRINEVDCRGRDRVELINVGDAWVTLAGWTLGGGAEMAGGPEGRHRLAGGIEPGEFEVIRQQNQTQDGFVFDIACAEQAVTLSDPDGAIMDEVVLDFTPAAYTWGRLPDGDGQWQRTAPTLGSPNAPPRPELGAPFDPTTVLEIDLAIGEESRAALGRAPREYVPAQLSVRGHTEQPLSVGLRIKGRLGSLRRLDQKPAWKIKIDFTVPDQRFLGRERLTLNNLVQDASQIHEWAAYTIFRTLDLPAPRLGYAFVRLDGEIYGVYTIIETPDNDLLGRWFASTQHLYEGTYGHDLFSNGVEQFEADRGDPLDRSDLRAVVERLEGAPLEEFYANSDDLVHWDRVLMTMAVEVWTGHWDGYAPTRNNYYFHFDDAGMLTLLPWGADQTFNREIGFHSGRGRLFEACLAAPVCRGRYDRTLAAVDQHVRGLDLPTGIRAQAETLQPWQGMDTRSGRSPQQLAQQVERTIAFIERRHLATAGALDCLLGPDADPDEDGHLCEADCDNEDPLVYPGAPEICGDGIDQDCNGRADDGPDCPDCVPFGQADHRYWVCPNRRPYAEAMAHCAAEEAELVHLQTAAENDWVRRRAAEVRAQDYWVGLTDAEEEGVFVWPDGSGVGDFAPWLDGEPNGGDRENCVGLRPQDGGWYDRRCGDAVAVLCEAPCAPVDADEDGVSICAGDCDDGDPNRAPGLAETCDDAIDNDCDGAVDEGRDCTCRGRLREGRRYFFCGEGASWVDARAECVARGGDLAVIEDAEENAYLREQAANIARANWWIGLSDSADEGTFVWVDGQALDYDNWSGNEPNDWREDEDCGELISGTGRWNDFRCDGDRPFICEGPPPEGP